MVDMQNDFQSFDHRKEERPQLLQVSFDNKKSQMSGDTYFERQINFMSLNRSPPEQVAPSTLTLERVVLNHDLPAEDVGGDTLNQRESN